MSGRFFLLQSFFFFYPYRGRDRYLTGVQHYITDFMQQRNVSGNFAVKFSNTALYLQYHVGHVSGMSLPTRKGYIGYRSKNFGVK